MAQLLPSAVRARMRDHAAGYNAALDKAAGLADAVLAQHPKAGSAQLTAVVGALGTHASGVSADHAKGWNDAVSSLSERARSIARKSKPDTPLLHPFRHVTLFKLRKFGGSQ